jgi:hypothetical protein
MDDWPRTWELVERANRQGEPERQYGKLSVLATLAADPRNALVEVAPGVYCAHRPEPGPVG